MQNISVIIITKNEEKNIAECISSVNCADEIIVVDAESNDQTVEIAKKFTKKVFVNKWTGYVQQKKYALRLVSNKWVLNLDADERLTPELNDEILNLDENECDGYRIKRKNFLFNKEIKYSGWGNDYQMRLFKKDKTDLTDRLVHEGFIVDGKIGTLESPLLHYTISSIYNYLKKINHYSTLKANEMFSQERTVNGWKICYRTLLAFFQFFIIRRGFKDGIPGLIISLLHSASTMLNYTKLWELKIKSRK